MAVSDMVNLSGLLDEPKCFDLVRQHRWPEGVRCADCDSAVVIRNGYDPNFTILVHNSLKSIG